MRLPSIHRSVIQLSATFGTSHLAFGEETIYGISSKRIREFNAGIRKKVAAAAAVISQSLSEKENVLVVRGTWIRDDLTTIKARFDSRGKLVTLLHHEIKPKTYVNISSEFDPKALDRILIWIPWLLSPPLLGSITGLTVWLCSDSDSDSDSNPYSDSDSDSDPDSDSDF
ncbi:unnamed protein product [Dovyalis caffra]|uniref:Uncharacterized protein n=1 Tax=Dovyalis caffra TaxID=77055 RepID=A0AAV1RB49_9ROSI|nr:unnamed protein product [Dovyalis caffra]